MIVREKLLQQLSTWATQSHWKETLQELISQILEVKPLSPYSYLQHKMQTDKIFSSLRQKFDNSRTSQYYIELTLFLSQIDPLIISDQLIKDKIINLCVQKYQHTKIKKTQIEQFIAIILLPIESSRKDEFVQLIDELLDRQIYTILQHANILYHTIIYRSALEQLARLQHLLDTSNINLSRSLFSQYINTVTEEVSMYKIDYSIQGQGLIHKAIAGKIVAKIFP